MEDIKKASEYPLIFEDLIALVIKDPSIRYDPVEVFSGYRICEGWYTCVDLSILLADPFKKKGYGIERISSADAGYTPREEVEAKHPFMAIKRKSLIVLSHAENYVIERHLQDDTTICSSGGHIYGRGYDHVALPRVKEQSRLEVSQKAISVFNERSVVRGSVANEMLKTLRDKGRRTTIKQCFSDLPSSFKWYKRLLGK